MRVRSLSMRCWGIVLGLACAGTWALPTSLPTNSGEILRQTQQGVVGETRAPSQDVLPPMLMPGGGPVRHGGAHVRVKSFVLKGVGCFKETELQALLKNRVGQEQDVADLYEAADQITSFYRQHGYILARAYVPAQDLDQGVVTLVVLEGHYGRIRLENGSRVRSSRLQPFLNRLQEGSVVQAATLERQLLLMNDIAGVEVHSTLAPGKQVGATALSVQAESTSRVQGQAGMDNWGERFTGATRATAQVDVMNLSGLGDHLDTYLMDTQYGGTKYGHVAYDIGVGGDGLRLGSSYDTLHYLLAQGYAPLDAYGSAQTGSAYVLWPWIRSREQTVDMTLNYTHRTLHDIVGSVGSQDAKWFQVGSLLLNGQQQLRGNALATWSMQLTHGVEHAEGVSTAGDQGKGIYTHLNLDASWLQPLVSEWSLYGHVQAQRASANLDLSEKMSLGGPQGVRAYPMGEVQADDAVLGTIELRRLITTTLQAWLFWDTGYGHSYHNPLASDVNNRRAIGGPGFGGNWNMTTHLHMRADLAWPVESPAVSAPQDRPTIWWQLGASF